MQHTPCPKSAGAHYSPLSRPAGGGAPAAAAPPCPSAASRAACFETIWSMSQPGESMCGNMRNMSSW
eukprot:366296-Chlamydomonas_euryale.AAC.11